MGQVGWHFKKYFTNNRTLFLTLLLSLSINFAILWEYIEWSVDLFSNISIRGKYDTMMDISMHIIATIIATIIVNYTVISE